MSKQKISIQKKNKEIKEYKNKKYVRLENKQQNGRCNYYLSNYRKNLSESHTLIKRQRLEKWMKNCDSFICYLQEKHVKFKYTKSENKSM